MDEEENNKEFKNKFLKLVDEFLESCRTKKSLPPSFWEKFGEAEDVLLENTTPEARAVYCEGTDQIWGGDLILAMPEDEEEEEKE